MLTGIPLLLLIACAILFIIAGSSYFKLHPFLVLLSAALLTGIVSGMPVNELVKTINEGFGDMMRHIGLIVILGSLIGIILEKTGATLRVAEAIIKLSGENYPVLAITIIGVVVGIPIFCDSGFIILNGLNKSLAQKTRASYAAIVSGLASGLYITHTLLPPHPGSLAGAANFGLTGNFGVVILIGLLLSIPLIITSLLFNIKFASKVKMEMLYSQEEDSEQNLPALWKSLLPIVLPVVLIAFGSFSALISLSENIQSITTFIGSPLIALLCGLILSLLNVKNPDFRLFDKWLKEGIVHAGNILIIVGAGGVFGAVLKKTSLADVINSVISTDNNMMIFLIIAWLIGVVLKTAQGSTTSAIIIATSILAPLTAAAGFHTPVQLSLLLAAVAGGAMMISHANDAYFWVITQFSGMNMHLTYRSFSLASIVMSVTLLISVLLVAIVIL